MQVRKNVATAATVAEKAPADDNSEESQQGREVLQSNKATPSNARATEVLQNTV